MAPPFNFQFRKQRRHGAVLIDQSSRDDTLAGLEPPGAAPAGAVSHQSSRDKRRKRSAGGSSMRGEGRAISAVAAAPDGERAREIQRVAAELFFAKGYEATTTREIARALRIKSA